MTQDDVSLDDRDAPKRRRRATPLRLPCTKSCFECLKPAPFTLKGGEPICARCLKARVEKRHEHRRNAAQ